jgi:tetratricopeptide (TPR) repeat protein
VKEPETAMALMTPEEGVDVDKEAIKKRFAMSDFLISSANQFGRLDFVTELFEYRISVEPDEQQKWKTDPQNWATLAFLYHQEGETDKAVETLETAKELIPSFATTATCFVDNIKNGREPQEGCQ